MSSFSSVLVLAVLISIFLPFLLLDAYAQLSPYYYANSCPDAHSIVQGVIMQARASDPRIPASLTRLHFHDCFVKGCDGSVLLDGSPTIKSEKFAPANNKSARGFPVVDSIKSALESACPGVVSCADILAMSAQISIAMSGGPIWSPMLGRKDSTTVSFSAAKKLPSPFDSVSKLKKKFAAVGLNTADLVTLSGAHTIGKAQCKFVTNRLYNFSNTNRPDPTMNSAYRALLTQSCPKGGNAAAMNNLDPSSPTIFDNHYYKNIMGSVGLLQSDQELLSSGGSTASLVTQYVTNHRAFSTNFATSMIKMGNISPLTGSAGEVRKNCRRVN